MELYLRKRFDHLVRELSLALGRPIPRYRLWLRLHEIGLDPERITGPMAIAFCEGPLSDFLADEGFRLGRRARRRLHKELLYFDPEPTSADDASPESRD